MRELPFVADEDADIAALKAANARLIAECDTLRATEARLREREHLYRFAIALTGQLVWTADVGGTVLSVSSGFSSVTGIARTTSLGEGMRQAIHPDDIMTLRAAWKDAVQSGRPLWAEFRMRVADGSYRTFVARAGPRVDDDGKICGWYGVTEDVADQRAAEAARAGLEERYRLAALATSDAIWDLDVVRDEIRWTDTTSRILRPADGPTTLGWWEGRIHPDDRDEVARSFRAALDDARKLHWSATYRFSVSEGQWADVLDRGYIIRDEAGRATRAVGAISDRTERRRAQAELQRMQAELIQVSRLSAMGAMASTLAHELNQPLTAITSYIRGGRRLMEDIAKPGVQAAQEALDAAETAALQAGKIVRHIRQFVARGAVSIRGENLEKLIEDAEILAFVDEHLHGVSHRIEFDPKARWVKVDRIQIQQVLINLIRNGIQAMDESPQREVLITTKALPGGMAEIRVSDTGSGLSPEIRDALFLPFRSTKSEGMGIGLSISRTIVEAHGGKIGAEDREGGGTTFRFTLPLAKRAEREES